ncbi:unnamed protein product, partial [Hymenolepis diminuta]
MVKVIYHYAAALQVLDPKILLKSNADQLDQSEESVKQLSSPMIVGINRSTLLTQNTYAHTPR